MPNKDLYERLIRFYEFQMGALPHRAELRSALEATFTPEDLRTFFLLPFFGSLTMESLRRKASRAGIPPVDVAQSVERLIPEGVIDAYDVDSQRVYSRSPMICLLELQVCNIENSPMREVCTKLMNGYIEGDLGSVPMRTPPYRVLPVEPTIRSTAGPRTIEVDEVIPDPREVLPIDVLSEMIRKEPLIAVADCYCRATKRNVGEPCGHPLEVCFYFNELAMVKMNASYAREIDYDEALEILRECETHGLVHNVSNCEGHIQTLCNCCACSCAVLRGTVRGKTLTSPSRFVVAYDASACTSCEACVDVCPMGNLELRDASLAVGSHCIGCGLCVSACPSDALRMVPREKRPKIYADNDALWRRINLESMAGLVLRRIAGR
jgi:Pyruvate/2-oxoacid:ferredoxin oxidoreductase delta subunit